MLLLTMVMLAGGCGPSAEELGQAVLWAAPIITLVMLAVARTYAALWRPLVAEMRLEAGPWLAVAGVQLTIALMTLIDPEADAQLVVTAVLIVGATYLTLAILGLRLVVGRSARAHAWVSLAPWIILYPPAVVLAVSGEATGQFVDFSVFIWVMPGNGGLVTGPVVFLAVLEVVVRRARARRLERLVLTEARVRRGRRSR